jgi:hypothetical protein
MRNDQAFLITRKIAEQKQVKVDGTRAMLLGANSPELPLDIQEYSQELASGKVGLDLSGGIEISVLPRRAADRIGLQ